MKGNSQRLYLLLVLLITIIILVQTKQDSLDTNITPEEAPTGGKELIDHNLRRLGYTDIRSTYNSYEQVKQDYKPQDEKSRLKDAGINEWEWKGPGNIGGRIRAVVTVPNKDDANREDIIIGSAGGGIWKSYNEGMSWTAIDDFMPGLTVTSLAVSPSNPDTIYAGTGEFNVTGAGIFMSVDRGDTWTRLASTNNANFSAVNRIALDPGNPQNIYAATKVAGPGFSGTVQFSEDAGASWSTILNINTLPLDIDIDPNNSNLILVGCLRDLRKLSRDNNGNFTTSSILGGNKQIPNSAGRIEVAFAPSQSGKVYASVDLNKGEIWSSSDHGVEWTKAGVTKGHGGSDINVLWWANLIWVSPLDANHIIFGSLDLHRSTDGGITSDTISDWTNYHTGRQSAFSAHADNHIMIPSLFYSASNKKIYLGNDGGIQSTNNISTVTKASGWINLVNSTLGITQFYGASASKDGSVWLGGTQDNSFMYGQSTSDWKQPITGDGSKSAISQSDASVLYANTNGNQIFKSTDGGTKFIFRTTFSWDKVSYCAKYPTASCCQNSSDTCKIGKTLYVKDSAKLISEFIKDPDNDLTIYGGGKRLWRSQDSLSSWSQIKSDVVAKRTLTSIEARNNGSTLAVGYTNGDVYTSYDSGANWSSELLNQTINVPYQINDIAIHPDDPERIVAATSAVTNSIYVSQDSGKQWTQAILPYQIPVLSVTWHPTNLNWLYAGTSLGVFASEDCGQNWNVTPIITSSDGSYMGDGPLFVQIEELFWQGDGSSQYPYHLCTATHGRGIWRSKFPIVDKVYVDKNCGPCGKGTLAEPYATLREANDKTGNGATIVFLSEEIHDEAPANILITDRKSLLPPNGKRVIVE